MVLFFNKKLLKDPSNAVQNQMWDTLTILEPPNWCKITGEVDKNVLFLTGNVSYKEEKVISSAYNKQWVWN